MRKIKLQLIKYIKNCYSIQIVDKSEENFYNEDVVLKLNKITFKKQQPFRKKLMITLLQSLLGISRRKLHVES